MTLVTFCVSVIHTLALELTTNSRWQMAALAALDCFRVNVQGGRQSSVAKIAAD
jgi:hypothetical protein